MANRPTPLLGAAREGWGGRLPPRYDADPPPDFHDRVKKALRPGIAILDLGAGASPSVPPAARPAGCNYVGLDVSESELRRAPKGSYDETVAADASTQLPEFRNRFELIVSSAAFEHIPDLAGAVANMRGYLAPGGHLISYLSGGLSVPSLLNRLLPERVGSWLVSRLTDREPEGVFPARYDNCSYAALTRLFAREWAEAEIVPIYTGGEYFRCSRLLLAAYLSYEEWTVRTDRRNLAQYYLVEAVADPQ